MPGCRALLSLCGRTNSIARFSTIRNPAVKTIPLSNVRTSCQFARTLPVMLGLLALAWPVFSQQPAAAAKSGADATKIYLQGERSVSVSYSGKAATVQALSSGQLRPLALAAGDLDGDGVED